jgi:transposase
MDAQKKTPVARERERADVQAKRESFKAQQPTLDIRRLVFVDEAAYRLGSSPRFGWSPRGKDAHGMHVQGKWQTVTMIGAIAMDGFRALMTINAGTSTDVFSAFVNQQLIPSMNSGEVVVMDNLSAHKNTAVIADFQRCGIGVLFTPPYSPEFNPIEKTWGKLKDILRRASTLTREAFDRAVATAMNGISNDDMLAWMLHAGYQAPVNDGAV